MGLLLYGRGVFSNHPEHCLEEVGCFRAQKVRMKCLDGTNVEEAEDPWRRFQGCMPEQKVGWGTLTRRGVSFHHLPVRFMILTYP